LDGLIQFIRNMGTARLVMMGGVLIGVFAFFWMIIGSVNTSSMVTLYTDLDPAAASSISQQLTSENIPHGSNSTGTLITVPSDLVDQLRLRFATEGLSGGVIGKEIFDGESSFGRTSFELNVNYVRAIEGELSRTIKSIRSVREVRVHVVMPERRPFQRGENSPSAAVLLQTSGNFSASQAQAIQSLVASAVPGLSSDRITITDTNGRLLADGSGESEVSGFSDMEEARLGKERIYRNKIEELIGNVVGRGMVRAEVSITMDMNRKTTSEVTFNPDGQVVVSSDSTEETSEEPLPGGQATVANNIPGAQQGPGQDNSTESSKTRELTNFENSKTETVTIQEPGRVTQVFVSVLVDYQRTLDTTGATVGTPTARPQAEVDQIFNLVKNALPPIEDAAGNLVAVPNSNITVTQMRFVDPTPIETTEDPFDFFGFDKAFVLEIAKYGVFLVMGLLILMLIVRPIVTKVIDAIPDAPPPVDPNAIEDRIVETPAIAAPGAPLSAELMAAAAAGDETAAAAVIAARESGALITNQMRTDSKIDVAQVEGRIQESAIKKVAEIIRSNPEESVAIVRTWLYAE
jgi:flagellar M-ring protein FliF